MKNKTFRNTALFILAIVISACSSENKDTSELKSESELDSNLGIVTNVGIVTNFLEDVKSIESFEEANAIVSFKEAAEDKANEVITLSKDNIADVFIKAKDYKHCVITVGDHTIVLVTDFENCQQSGSWAACIPFGKGYIKKGTLSFKEDYMNNIIGRPDSQERKAYLFK